MRKTNTRTTFAQLGLGLSLLLLLAALGGCAQETEAPETVTGEQMEETVAAPETMVPDIEPDADALWSHLEFENYDDRWELWPGTSRFYEGTRPHGALLTTFVNDVAEQAIRTDAQTMPQGSIIVKENFTEDGNLAAVTAMYKVGNDYDPDHNNWFWLKRLPDGTVEASGKVDSCISCHGKQADNDYLFTGQEG